MHEDPCFRDQWLRVNETEPLFVLIRPCPTSLNFSQSTPFAESELSKRQSLELLWFTFSSLSYTFVVVHDYRAFIPVAVINFPCLSHFYDRDIK